MLAPTAAARFGVQPVVSVSAQVDRDEVTFEVAAECPPDAGTIVATEFDFEGSGTWEDVHEELDRTEESLGLAVRHRYPAAGAYTAAVRVTSHRDGEVSARSGRISNLARCRLLVQP
jgi:hypothetical protein